MARPPTWSLPGAWDRRNGVGRSRTVFRKNPPALVFVLSPYPTFSSRFHKNCLRQLSRHPLWRGRCQPIALQLCRWPDPITSRCSKAAVELAELTLAGISSWSTAQFERPIGSNHVNISLPPIAARRSTVAASHREDSPSGDLPWPPEAPQLVVVLVPSRGGSAPQVSRGARFDEYQSFS